MQEQPTLPAQKGEEYSEPDADEQDTSKSTSTAGGNSFPSLTVDAHGTAERFRQVCDSEHTEALETQEVQLSLSHEIQSYGEWTDLISADFNPHRPTVRKGNIVDRLFDQLSEHYERPSSTPDDPPCWTVSVSGSATAWRRFFMEYVQTGAEEHEHAYQGVAHLSQLLSTDIAGDGAALAALDLINEYDLDHSREQFVEDLQDDADGE
ncbi:hypothetical protein [Haloarcula montana]|uniref:hypothetical protein n=1 Tax=Haloarcula montana TaxID=3111776 RepID=UPI002D76C25E|nr:hypothetical protein [Haloarcula sp. GH36]